VISRVFRYLGATALLGAGIVHLQQYDGAEYSVIPTIGTLFVLNFAASTVLAVALFAPVRRWGAQLVAAAGVAVALGSLAALLISEQTPLFGFMENGYRQAIVIAIALEGAAAALLSVYLVRTLRPPR
jgi:hypothetical protein